MKIYKKFITLTLAIVAFSVVSISAQSFTAAGANRALEDRIKKKILMLPRYEVFDHIGFRLEGGTVTLFGKVRNATNKDGAEDAIERLDGVTNVVNNIEVLSLGGFDDRIRRELYRTLSNSGSLSRYLWTVNPPVRLIVDGGHVSLEGVVANRGDYNTMNILAHGVSGVFSVTNNLVIDDERAR